MKGSWPSDDWVLVIDITSYFLLSGSLFVGLLCYCGPGTGREDSFCVEMAGARVIYSHAIFYLPLMQLVHFVRAGTPKGEQHQNLGVDGWIYPSALCNEASVIRFRAVMKTSGS